MCKYESVNGKCALSMCMYAPIAYRRKYDLCELARKRLDYTTADCDDCKARTRNEAIEEFYLGIKDIFEKYANDDWNKSTTATWAQGYESATETLEDYYDNLLAEQLKEKQNG